MIQSILKILSFLPLPVLHALGCVIGLSAYALSSKERIRSKAHLGIAIQSTGHHLKTLLLSAMHRGMALIELGILWGRSYDRGLKRFLTVEGWDAYESAHAKGRGVMIVTAHLGAFEAAPAVFATKHQLTVLYKPNKNPRVQEFIEKGRQLDGVSVAPANLGGVRILLKALRAKNVIAMVPDQVPSFGEGGVVSRFFGKPAFTMTLPGSLYSKCKPAVIIFVMVRLPFRGFRLEMEELEVPESLDQEALALFFNQALEKLILKYPEQYYWGYKRYKMPAEVLAND